jgi:hypothetical protein
MATSSPTRRLPRCSDSVRYVRYFCRAGEAGGMALHDPGCAKNSGAAEWRRTIFPQITNGEVRLAAQPRVRLRRRTRFPSVHASSEFSHNLDPQPTPRDCIAQWLTAMVGEKPATRDSPVHPHLLGVNPRLENPYFPQ